MFILKLKNMLYSVTIMMISYNDQDIIFDCLESIRLQNYQGKVDVLIMDGGSTDNTLNIIKKFNAKVIIRPDLKNHPNKRLELGMNSIQTDIALILSADNRFQEKNCLKKMLEPFLDKEIVAVETFKYGFNNKSSLLTKYFALIGGADPISIALGKSERSPYDKDKWHSFGKVENKKNYFKITFNNDANKIPTLGANGFAVRNLLFKKYPPKDGLHIEMCMDFIKNGYNKFAFVRNVHIIHEINIGILSFCKRRLQWAYTYSSSNMKRRYFVFNFPHDLIRLIFIILSTITIIIPLMRAIKGFIKYKNVAWFLHPFILLIFLITYGLQTIRSFTKNLFNAININH